MAHRRLFVVSLIGFVVLLGVGIVVPILPLYAQDLGANAFQIGMIFASFSLSKTIFTPIIGGLSDVTGRKKLIILGLGAYTVVALMYVLAIGPLTLIAVRSIHGVASAFILPVAMSYAGLIAKQGEEGLFMGTFNMALFLGMGTGPFIGGVLTRFFGMDTAFFALSLLSLLALVITWGMLPGSIRATSMHETRRPQSLGIVFKSRMMKGLLVSRLINSIGRGGLLAFLPLLATARGIDKAEVGMLISFTLFITGILQRPFGRMVDNSNAIGMVVAGSIVGALSFGGLPFGRGFLSFLSIASLMGLGGAISIPAISVMAVEEGRTLGMGKTMGLLDTARSLGMIVGPVISGGVMAMMGIDSVFYTGGILIMAGVVVFLLYARQTPWLSRP
ncbi:MAG: MFS transporter [Deltaproteobacteria bacterium]|nr:MAG: MFS transporter [Deltaproteobacteria bacterium]